MGGKVVQLVVLWCFCGLCGLVLVVFVLLMLLVFLFDVCQGMVYVYDLCESIVVIVQQVFVLGGLFDGDFDMVIVDSLVGVFQVKSVWLLVISQEDIMVDVLKIDVLVIVIFGEYDWVDLFEVLFCELLLCIFQVKLVVFLGVGYLLLLEVLVELISVIKVFVLVQIKGGFFVLFEVQ